MSANKDRIDCEYVLLAEDVLALRRYLRDRLPDGRRLSWVHTGVVFALPIVFFGVLAWAIAHPQPVAGNVGDTQQSPPSAFIYFIMALLALLIFRRPIADWMTRRHFRKAALDSPLIQPRKMSLSPEAFSAATPLSSERHAWAVVQRVVFDYDHAFLMIGPQHAHIIPRRSLTNATWEDLIDFLKQIVPEKLQNLCRKKDS